MKLLWNEKAFEFYISLMNEDKKHMKRINKILIDIQRNGINTTLGKVEKLKGFSDNRYSVRINEKDRILFRENNNCIEILSINGHYDDK